MIAGITDTKEEELSEYWERTKFSSLCDEELPSVYSNENGGISSISNFALKYHISILLLC